jgi:hypothetical protein
MNIHRLFGYMTKQTEIWHPYGNIEVVIEVQDNPVFLRKKHHCAA